MTSRSAQKRNKAAGKLSAADFLIVKTFIRLDELALGAATGIVIGLLLFTATLFLLLGSTREHHTFSLLGQFLIGYEVSWLGSLIGFVYGFLIGFIFGWLAAFIRNLVLSMYLRLIKLRNDLSAVQDFMDSP